MASVPTVKVAVTYPVPPAAHEVACYGVREPTSPPWLRMGTLAAALECWTERGTRRTILYAIARPVTPGDTRELVAEWDGSQWTDFLPL